MWHHGLFDCTFNDFVISLKDRDTFNLQQLWHTNSQSSQIKIDGKIATDFIIRFHFLQEDLDIMCDKIGISHFKIPHFNKSKRIHKDMEKYYDEHTWQIVKDLYQEDAILANN